MSDRFPSHRRTVQDMKPIAAVEYLLNVLDDLGADNVLDDIAPIVLAGFRLKQAIILRELIRHEDRICPRDALYTALCRGKLPEEYPDPHIIAVYVCHIRKKLPEGFSIRAVYGLGFCLSRQAGARFPWEDMQ